MTRASTTCSREYSATVRVTNVPPVVTSLALPSNPVAVNTPVTLGAAFTDPGIADTHTGSFELGSGGAGRRWL